MKCCKSWKLDGPKVPQCVAAQRRLSRGLSGRYGCNSSLHENMKFCSFQKQRWRGKSETTRALVKKAVAVAVVWFASLSYEIIKTEHSWNFEIAKIMKFHELSWTFMNFHELSRTFMKLCSLKVITLQWSTGEFSKIMKSQSFIWVSFMKLWSHKQSWTFMNFHETLRFQGDYAAMEHRCSAIGFSKIMRSQSFVRVSLLRPGGLSFVMGSFKSRKGKCFASWKNDREKLKTNLNVDALLESKVALDAVVKSWSLNYAIVLQCVAVKRRLGRELSRGRHSRNSSSCRENLRCCSFQKQLWQGKESYTMRSR